jgi:uncharacterized integral membrane protein
MTTDPQPAPTPTPPTPPTPPTTPPPAETPAGQPAPETTPQAPPQPPAPAARTAPAPAPHTIRRTRISGLWVAVGFFAVILLLLLIFILQNGQKVDISYMGAHGHLPLGVALLLAAVCGVLLVVLAGTARISQLRAVHRRHRRADTRRAKAAAREPANPGR